MWRVLLSAVAACSFEHGLPAEPPDAGVDARPAAFHLHVEAWMDGRSNLIIAGTSVRWHHFQYAAPGREVSANLPTKLGATDWFPTWPDIPTAENRDCNCESSTFSQLPSAIPRAASTTSLRITQARVQPSVLQKPAAANDYTLIVELTDVGPGGSAWHIIDIDVTPN